jgi:hypothetical protein
MNKSKAGFLILSTLVSPVAMSATQGTLGTTSTGTVAVSITIPSLVQITGLSDIALTPTTISGSVTGNTTACIYSNVVSPLGSYFVTATSANAAAGAFRVNNGGTTGTYITYSAFWNNSSAPAQTTALTSGTKSAQQTGGSAVSLTCGGTPNANFNISFSSAQIAGAVPNTYTDTVTLLITPT